MISKEELVGRTAVVTGAGSGIGAALVAQLGDLGMRVVVADIDLTAAQEVAARIIAAGGTATAARVDVSDPISTEALAQCAYDTYGSVHLLCNNAGVLLFGDVVDATIHDWRWLSAVNIEGTLNCLGAFLPKMREQKGWRHITNTASTHAFLPATNFTALYTATKMAIVSITRSLRDELEPQGIGVTMVCPGQVATRLLDAQRNRSEAFGPKAQEPFGTDTLPLGIDPAVVGRDLVTGVLENRPLVFSMGDTSHYRDQVETGWRELDEALAPGANDPREAARAS